MVQALQQLPLLALSLGIHAYEGTEATRMHYQRLQHYDGNTVELPHLAELHLTALRLIGCVVPPPDLLALPHLRSLTLHTVKGAFWIGEPWSSLAHLSQLEIIATRLPGKRCCTWSSGCSS